MSGHSKWKNIMHKKEKTDAQRAKLFTKIGKEIAIAVKSGGPDPVANSKLKDLIAKAKANNVPNDNIDRIIKKASSDDAEAYETIIYEGYGPCGVAVIVETATDNRNRTASDMRHYFDKFGGNLGTTGCVSFMFDDKGVILISAEDLEEDKVMEDALEAGAEDISLEGEYYEVTCDVGDLYIVKDALEQAGYEIESAEEDKIPQSYVEITNEDDITKMTRLLDMLDENEDVQNVYHNWENEER
ncbi:MAG: YebC/PmpR family DNA-binding transcriptional regulator [Ruminococcaceae bacterium]|nr:YebC/PmpR family DNA-binding transcriptional regulator [Oscillospiraceae bacterium]